VAGATVEAVFRFVEHTAELEVELEAGTPEGVLEEARRAFAELAGTGDGEAVQRDVDIEAPDLPALLAAWLDELVFLADAEGLVAESAELTLAGPRLTGVVRGRLGEPRPLVKAVTLHRLRFRPEDGVWRGRVVLDV
jgi:SHS2 domain-containing protein